MTDIELKNLVERAKNKDNVAMETLYREYYKEVLYVCRRYNMNSQDAEDITQDAFVSAFSSLSSLDNAEKFGAWISRIAANKCLNLLKRNNILTMESIDDGENIIELPSKDKNTEDVVIDREVQNIITNMIQELPIEQRVTLFMYYYQDMSIKEIANSFNCSENTIKSRLNYAKKHMRIAAEKLENQGVKLRTIAVLPFLYAFFHMEKDAFACVIPDAAPAISAAMARMSGAAANIGNSINIGNAGNAATNVAKMSGAATKAMSAGKIAAIIGGAVGTVAVVAGVIIAVALSGDKDNDIIDSKNGTEYTSAELVTTEKPTDTEEPTDDDEVKWVYDKDYKVDIKFTEIKEFSAKDFPELENINAIWVDDCTRNTVRVTVRHNYEIKDGYENYDTIEYLYNVNGERIDIGVDLEKETCFGYCYSDTKYDLNTYCYLDYIWVDEDKTNINTTKLIDINGKEIIPAKYHSYIMLSENYVMALRGELGKDGTVNRSNVLYSSDNVDVSDYHDVIDVYNIKTGEVIDELSNIDGKYIKNLSAVNDYVIYRIYEDSSSYLPTKKIAYDVEGNKVDIDKVHKDALDELGVESEMSYEEILDELAAEYRIKEGVLSTHIEDRKGNVVSEYYNEIHREGDYFITNGRQEGEYDSVLEGYDGYGILNKDGSILVDCILDEAPVPYGYDLWMIVYNGKIGFMNQKGEIVGQFTQIEDEYYINDSGMVTIKDECKKITPNGIVEFGESTYEAYINEYMFAFETWNKDTNTIKSSTLYDYVGNEIMTTGKKFYGWGGNVGYKVLHEYICENDSENVIAKVYRIEISR